VTDIFEEVEEQLRSERYVTLVRRGWPWVLGLAIALLAAALAWWGYSRYRDGQDARASEDYAAALDTLKAGDEAKAFTQFQAAAKTPSRGYKALALMQEGGIRMDQNKVQEAVALFDQAASAAPDLVIGDMARLKSAFALMDTAPYPAIEERLKPLTDAKHPYRAAAREALAMAELKAGKLKAARDDFVVIRLLPDAPDSMRQRAELAIAAIDSGSVASLPQAVVEAAKAPPPPPPSLSNLAPQTGAGQ
jgi:hypothetical protein